MEFSKLFLKVANSILSLIVIVCLFITGSYAVYALWDNQQILSSVDSVQDGLLGLKPVNGASFDELLAINPDVCAWLTLDNTMIDYPVVQGEDNLTYLNMDVYGDFALAGSIFLDSRNDKNFNDAYSLIYGHHMDQHKMFGDLDLYKKKKFFKKNKTGTLILPDREYDLEIFACMIISASDDNIFDTDTWQTDIDGLLNYVNGNAKHVRKSTIKKIEQMDDPHILALSTCSEDYTDARTVILAVMEQS